MRQSSWGLHPSLWAIALLIISYCTLPASGDVVLMKDGRIFTGMIVTQTNDQVIIDTIVSGIRVKMPLRRPDIDSITLGPVDDDFFGKPKEKKKEEPTATEKVNVPAPAEPQVPAPEVPANIPAKAYLEIPIVGTFGTEVVPAGVEAALEYATQHEAIKHIVFVVDSPGGSVDAAEKILGLMKKHNARFTYHCVIKRAISASIWVVFACDTIHIIEGGTVGGAVAFSQDESTGNLEVDAKFNSVICANIRATADSKSHPAVLVEAMMIQDATAAAWTDEGGRPHIGKVVGKGVPAERVIFKDTNKTVLTLTAREATQIQMADALTGNGNAVSLGEAMGFEGWGRFNDYGGWAMTEKSRPYRDFEKKRNRIDELAHYIGSTMDEAVSNDPERAGDYSYFQRTGRFTDDSRRLWIQRTNSAIAAWERAEKGIAEFQGLLKEAASLGITDGFPELNVQNALDRCGREIKRLKMNRGREGV